MAKGPEPCLGAVYQVGQERADLQVFHRQDQILLLMESV